MALCLQTHMKADEVIKGEVMNTGWRNINYSNCQIVLFILRHPVEVNEAQCLALHSLARALTFCSTRCIKKVKHSYKISSIPTVPGSFFTLQLHYHNISLRPSRKSSVQHSGQEFANSNLM